MNFQELVKIEEPQFYIDLAFRQSRVKGDIAFKRSSGDITGRIRKTEIERLKIFRDVIKEKFSLIIDRFPSIDNMPEFYQELVRCTLDYDYLKKSLGAVQWCVDKTRMLTLEHDRMLRRVKSKEAIKKIMNSYYGRINSIIKRIGKYLRYMEHARSVMRDYPTLKTDMFTVVITGFPNIGKSTLLSKLTDAKPKIADYAFTTKSLNQGYAHIGLHKIQYVDTPGVLGRDKMNNIEMQAYLVLKYLANMIVYVIDLTEPYPLEKQALFLEELEEYDKPIIIYLSKSDVLDEKIIAKYKKKFKAIIDLEKLKGKIEKSLN